MAQQTTSLLEVADSVRAAVAPHAGGPPVAVFIDDIRLPEPEEAGVAAP